MEVAAASLALKMGLPQITEGEKAPPNELLHQYVTKLRRLMMELEEKCHLGRKCVTYKRYTPPWSPETFDKELEETTACMHTCKAFNVICMRHACMRGQHNCKVWVPWSRARSCMHE